MRERSQNCEAVIGFETGVSTPVRESNPNVAQNSVNHKKAHFHQVLMRFFQRQTIFWRVYQELPWHMKMSGYWEGLCNFITNPR
jgi:hypothetical protein